MFLEKTKKLDLKTTESTHPSEGISHGDMLYGRVDSSDFGRRERCSLGGGGVPPTIGSFHSFGCRNRDLENHQGEMGSSSQATNRTAMKKKQ